MDSQTKEMIEVYNVNTATAVQVLQGLAETPPVLPGIIYKQWVLQRLLGLSKEQASRYLHKWGYEREDDGREQD